MCTFMIRRLKYDIKQMSWVVPEIFQWGADSYNGGVKIKLAGYQNC